MLLVFWDRDWPVRPSALNDSIHTLTSLMARKASPWDFGTPDKTLLLKDGFWRKLLMSGWCNGLYLAKLNSPNCCVCEDEVFECRKLKRRDRKSCKVTLTDLTTCTLKNKCFRRNIALKNSTLMMFWTITNLCLLLDQNEMLGKMFTLIFKALKSSLNATIKIIIDV